MALTDTHILLYLHARTRTYRARTRNGQWPVRATDSTDVHGHWPVRATDSTDVPRTFPVAPSQQPLLHCPFRSNPARRRDSADLSISTPDFLDHYSANSSQPPKVEGSDELVKYLATDLACESRQLQNDKTTNMFLHSSLVIMGGDVHPTKRGP